MQPSNILVRATNWIGDAVMSVPALNALREAHSNARITVLAKTWVAALYERESFCDEVVAFEQASKLGVLSSRWQLARKLRKRAFDCAVIFPNSFDSALVPFLAGIPNRIGYSRDARRWLLSHPIPEPAKGDTPPHESFRYLELLKRAGLIPSFPPVTRIRLTGAVKGRLRGPVVGICPGAAYGSAKRWLPKRFAEAAAQACRELGGSAAIFGSETDVAVCAQVAQDLQQTGISFHNFAGQTTLAELVELIGACELFITNDSGPMHIASAAGVPTVAVFGPTDEYATGPLGEHAKTVRVPVECSPCLLRECPIDHRCMTRISSELVAEAAVSLLGTRRTSARD